MYILPLFGDSNNPAKCKKVDLPDPDDPTKATMQLLFSIKFTEFKTLIILLPCLNLWETF